MSNPGKQTKAQAQRSKRIGMNKNAARMLPGGMSETLSEAARIAGATAGTVTLASALGATPVHALPQNGTVMGGSVSMAQTGSTLNINQGTNSAIINWQGYNIAAGETVQYLQPGSSSIILNRVTGADPSAIYGNLSANGQVWVINPNGLLVGEGARVETGSFLGSTLGISNEDFSAGNFRFTGSSSSLSNIINHGNITAADGGYVVLAAPSVTNTGVISAHLGKVFLASGDQLTLGFQGNDLIDLVITEEAASEALGVKNTGTITADGGTVVMSAKVAAGLLQEVVNNQGIVRATSIVEKDGAIILDGGEHGMATNSGTLDASGRDAGEKGGAIKVLGDQVTLSPTAVLDASGDAGGGTIVVGGNFHGAGPEGNSTATTVAQGAELKADAVTDGDGGKVAVWSDGTTEFHGHITAKGGTSGGNGGLAEVSGKTHLALSGFADLSAANGEAGVLEIDPGPVSIIDGTVDPNPGKDTITDGWISTQLESGNLTISTSDSTAPGNENIALAPEVDINWISGNTLTLTAGKDITMEGALTAAAGRLDLKFDTSGTGGTLSFGNAHVNVGTVNILGSGVTSTIVGPATGNTFEISRTWGGWIDGKWKFDNVGNLTGGSGDDTFHMTSTGELPGNVVGGDGNDTFDASSDVAAFFRLDDMRARHLGGTFSEIETLKGDPSYPGILHGSNTGQTYRITGVNRGTVDDLNFVDLAGIYAGSGNDTFIFENGGSLGNLMGGLGSDTLSYAGRTGAVVFDQRLNKSTGVAAETLEMESLIGNGVNTTIIGNDLGQIFTVSGADTGTAGALAFTGVGNLTGGLGADSFIIQSGGSLTGKVEGGGVAGDGVVDSLDLSAKTSVVLDRQNATVVDIIGSFSGIETAAGNGTDSTIVGLDSGETFTVTARNEGTVDSGSDVMAFSGFNNLTGGSGADSFIIQDGGSLTGNLAGGGTAGDGVEDSLDLSAKNTDLIFDRETGKATAIDGTYHGIEAVVGNGARSTIVGAEAGESFDITGADTGWAGDLKFKDVGNLRGGSGADTFIIHDTTSLSGTLEGGGMVGDGVKDTLDLSASSSATLNRENGTANGISFSGMERAVGNGSGSTIVGRNSGERFTVTGPNSGTVDSGSLDVMEFAGFSDFTGGSGADLFIIHDGGSLTGNVAGGGSAGDGVDDSLDMRAKSSDITFDLGTGKATDIGGTFSGIESVIGNGAKSTIIGGDLGQTFEVTGDDTGTVGDFKFIEVGNLTGGSGADSFIIHDAGRLSGSVVGGGTIGDEVDDLLDLSAKSGEITVNQQTRNATGIGGTFSDIESVIGNGVHSTIIGSDLAQTFRVTGLDTGTAGYLKFSGVGNLTGGSGADSFVIQDAGRLSGNVVGGGTMGNEVVDRLDLSAKSGEITFNQGTGKATGIGGIFSGIESVVGNGVASTIIGGDLPQTFQVTGVDTGTAGGLKFSGVGNLTGGSGADLFVIGDGGSLSGKADGGLGRDTLSYAQRTGEVVIEQQSSQATGLAGYSGIERVVGNGIGATIKGADGGEVFTLAAADSGTAGALEFTEVGNLAGGSGDDTFVLEASGRLSGNLGGGAGHDTLDLHAKAESVSINQQEHTAAGIGGTYSGIERAVGNGANSTIIGHDRGEIFIVTGVDSGTADANAPNAAGGDPGVPRSDRLEFEGFGNLQGGALDDYFYIKAGGRLTGNLDGGTGSFTDHLYLSQKTEPITLNLEEHTVTGVGKAFTDIESVSGNGVNSTIIGHNLGDTFYIAGADSGAVVSESSGSQVDFEAFGNLVGGTGNDSFFGLSGSVLSGSIADHGGVSTLAGTVTTVSTQSYAGPATLASGTTLRGERVTLNGLTGNGHDLTIDGAAVFNGADVAGIKDLQITRTAEVNVARISGSGAQHYDELVTLGGDATLGGSEVAVNAVAGGEHDLTVISSGTGGITINGEVGTTGGVELVAFQGAITETGDGAVSAASLSTASARGQTLEGANSVSAFEGTNSGTGSIIFNNGSENLTVAGISNNAGSVHVANGGSISLTEGIDSAGDVDLKAGNGGISVSGGINAAENVALTAATGDISLAGVIDTAAEVHLTSNGGTITQSGTGSVINAALLGTTSKGGQTLSGPNRVRSFTATNDGGDVLLNNTSPTLEITGINQVDGGSIEVANTGKILVSGGVRAKDDILLHATDSSIELSGKVETDKDVKLFADGAITGSGGGSVRAAALATESKGGLVLNEMNEVRSFDATNVGGNISFRNGPELDLGKITQEGGDITVTNSGSVRITDEVKITKTAATPTTVAITSVDGDIEGAGGSLTADSLNLTGKVIGAHHGAWIEIEASSVTTNTTREIDGVSAAFTGAASYFTVHDEAPSVVLLNGVVVGGQLAGKFQGAVQLGGSNAAMAVNAQEMQKMLLLANFQEFFAQAPKVQSLDADDTAFTPVQQIIPGFLSDGRPCQLIDSKIK